MVLRQGYQPLLVVDPVRRVTFARWGLQMPLAIDARQGLMERLLVCIILRAPVCVVPVTTVQRPVYRLLNSSVALFRCL